MTPQELISRHREALIQIIQGSFAGATAQSIGFSVRILGDAFSSGIPGDVSASIPTNQETIQYAGYTGVAFLGFRLGSEERPTPDNLLSFVTGLSRLRSRSQTAIDAFISDDVAILGVSDGLARVKTFHLEDVSDITAWFLQLLDHDSTGQLWSSRMRALAGELLDPRGRLQVTPDLSGVNEAALETVLRVVWPSAFIGAPALSEEIRSRTLKWLLTEQVPQTGELERAAVWFRALDAMVDYACRSLLPTISDTVRILESIQHSLKRWVWTIKGRRREALPSRWLIDNEYDVQSLLWAILYPLYGADLVDETYLPNWGHVQPRADLGILKLKLIIEVKFARELGDFKKFEGEIGGDLGLYFKDPSQFDRMIVFIYDDCDAQHVEKYDSLKNALKKRERIEEVIIVRRPGMIPNRDQRNN